MTCITITTTTTTTTEMDFLRAFLRSFRFSNSFKAARAVLAPHYITNILLATSFYFLKTIYPVCEYLFGDCLLELQHWEWLTFLGCVIVLKNRKEVQMTDYIDTACMLGKALNIVLYYQYYVPYAVLYFVLCLVHFVLLPAPVYQGPEFVTYFRGPHLKSELERDKRVTWLICFYAAWSPACVSVAPMFAELSAEYHLEHLKFGKLDVSRYSAVGDEYKVNGSSFSKQLPTIILFQNGKEKMRRPEASQKGTVIKYQFTKENIIKDFELNEVYHQCKKSQPKQKDKKEKKED